MHYVIILVSMQTLSSSLSMLHGQYATLKSWDEAISEQLLATSPCLVYNDQPTCIIIILLLLHMKLWDVHKRYH